MFSSWRTFQKARNTAWVTFGQKVLNDRMNLENNKATPSRKFSTQEGLALVAAFGQTLQIFQDAIVSQFAKET